MRTLATCLPADRCERAGTLRQARGFSLLELLIVLALMGLALALVGPALQRTYDSLVRTSERDEARRQLERLPLLVRETGRRLEVPAGETAFLTSFLALPAGWSAEPLVRLVVEASGVCQPAQIRLRGADDALVVALEAPHCRVSNVP